MPDEQLSLAIGRRGQNVRLASQLTGLDIDILTEEEESQRRQKEFEERTALFVDALDLDEFFAQLLVAEGFTNLEEVAYVDRSELTVIDGVDDDTAEELQTRAAEHLEAIAAKALEQARALGAEDSLIEFEGADAPDGRGAGQGRSQVARGLRDVGRLGRSPGLDRRERRAQEG